MHFIILSCCLIVTAVIKARVQGAAQCSRARAAAPAEGVLGSRAIFPWLGVLRVHLHEESGMKIALTGIVLVKDNYALGNADDIARIPKRIFQEESRAMFIPTHEEPWFCRLLDYMAHPEYELDTLSSVALLELSLEDTHQRLPMLPACWPPAGYNVTADLYAMGYTDENSVLEKFIHRLEYVQPELCQEFYNRAGLQEGRLQASHVTCGHAVTNRRHCVWDNGMALASNSSGHWVLLGLSLHGPGCSAPARFISLLEYFPWIESATSVAEQPYLYRKTAFDAGFRAAPRLSYVPAHELLAAEEQPWRRQGLSPPLHTKHEFAHYYPYDMVLDDPFYIKRINGTRIDIIPARGHYRALQGNCSVPGLVLVYKDHIKIDVSPDTNQDRNSARYQLTLMDTEYSNYTCVSLRLHVKVAKHAYLRYLTELDDAGLFPEEPWQVVRSYPLYQLSRLWEKGELDHLAPAPVRSPARNITGYNLNLFLEATFVGSCKLEIAIYGLLGEHPVQRYPTTTSTTTTSTANPTTDPYKGQDEALVLRGSASDTGQRLAALERAQGAAAGGGGGASAHAAGTVLCYTLMVVLTTLVLK